MQSGTQHLAVGPGDSYPGGFNRHHRTALRSARVNPQGVGRAGQKGVVRQTVLGLVSNWNDALTQAGVTGQLPAQRLVSFAQALAALHETEIMRVRSQKVSEATAAVSTWSKVLSALENPKWDFRTVDSIAQETQLEPSHVKALLSEHASELRRPVFPDRKGRELFTSRNRRLVPFQSDIFG